jgi:8-oxo-dGTP pyrophosphatase MutT (NUDIX family)
MRRPDISDAVLRVGLSALHQIRRIQWYFTQPRTFGAHAVPLTPRGTIVLVKLRYARGWRLPGGGRKPAEAPLEAALRELREEIGLITHGEVQPVAELEERPDFKRDSVSLFIVRNVEYRPRWSLEVEAVTEVEPTRLPLDISPRTLGWLRAVAPLV